ncbi:MAG: glycosyltransferase family 2 protein [Nitrospiraceae bacterium]|nr:MAG: glycosyltransferase family 2 protein [Nitrospiraceae bacterium]
MFQDRKIAVIIPALNEEKTLPHVLSDIPQDLVDEVVVVDNGSSDRTSAIAKDKGATILAESRRGYGYPCLRGIEYLKTRNPDIVVFVDGNYSDHPDEISRLVTPMIEEDYDLVLGSRILGKVEKGALRFPVRFGNFLATLLIRIFYGFSYTDVGPFRAIKFDKLLKLDMHDNLGWTIEMQVKAVKAGFRIVEVPVSYRAGTGKSKLTGNIKGIIIVGYRILRAVFKNLFYSPK